MLQSCNLLGYDFLLAFHNFDYLISLKAWKGLLKSLIFFILWWCLVAMTVFSGGLFCRCNWRCNQRSSRGISPSLGSDTERPATRAGHEWRRFVSGRWTRIGCRVRWSVIAHLSLIDFTVLRFWWLLTVHLFCNISTKLIPSEFVTRDHQHHVNILSRLSTRYSVLCICSCVVVSALWLGC